MEGLPFPVLLSTALGMNEMVIAGQHVEFIHVFYTWMAMLILGGLGLAVRSRLELIPGGLQNGLEALIGGLEKFTIENMGEEEGKRFFPVLCILFLFILTMNLLGLIPGCEAPTANLNTTAALAIFVFVYYNAVGIYRWHGHYIQQFMGPLPALAPFMMIIEIVSHLSRPLSLMLRLFGNIQGEAMILILFFMLAPIFSTLPIYFLFLLGKMLQAFIFFMLTIIYLKGAVEGAH